MRTKTRIVSLRLLPLLMLLGLAAPSFGSGVDLAELARTALRGDTAAEAGLRAAGQGGVDALVAERPSGRSNLATWEQTLDRVCAQRFCRHSRLFWHTDLGEAVAEAERSGRPILSLRLLGRLDEDRSCANSRFFRTVLYADPAVAGLLRERFVLHWSSERPVPKLTIDYGDGRRIEGTITGNSIHYVLDSHGRLVDALPGLYGPGLFRERLGKLAALATGLQGLDAGDFLSARRGHHLQQLDLLGAPRSLWRLAPEVTRLQDVPGTGRTALAASAPPTAEEAARLATSKSSSELKVVQAFGDGPEEMRMPDARWTLMAFERPDDWRLSRSSRNLLLRTHADYVRAAGGFSGLDEAETARRALDAFEQTVGTDTMRNEFDLHPKIHRRLAEALDPADAEPGIELFNRWVYDELFLTPASDPWLGLWSPEVIAALAPVDGSGRAPAE